MSDTPQDQTDINTGSPDGSAAATHVHRAAQPAPQVGPPPTVRRRMKARRTAFMFVGVVGAVIGIGIGGLIEKHRIASRAIVVSVNGTVITKDDLFRQMDLQVGSATVKRMVADDLAIQYAAKSGLAPTQPEIDVRYTELLNRSDSILGHTAENPGEVKDRIRVQLSQSALLTKGVKVTEADVRRFYDLNVDPRNPTAAYYTPEAAEVELIVTPAEQDADKAVAELVAGKPFALVAQQYSREASKDRGGVMPVVVRGRSWAARIPDLEKVIFATKIGQRAGPVQIAGAWWIIQVLDRKLSRTLPFDQVRNECRTGALLLKGTPVNGKQVQADFEVYRKSANIQAFWPEYKPAVDQMK